MLHSNCNFTDVCYFSELSVKSLTGMPVILQMGSGEHVARNFSVILQFSFIQCRKGSQCTQTDRKGNQCTQTDTKGNQCTYLECLKGNQSTQTDRKGRVFLD